jgi:hypothetical protein
VPCLRSRPALDRVSAGQYHNPSVFRGASRRRDADRTCATFTRPRRRPLRGSPRLRSALLGLSLRWVRSLSMHRDRPSTDNGQHQHAHAPPRATRHRCPSFPALTRLRPAAMMRSSRNGSAVTPSQPAQLASHNRQPVTGYGSRESNAGDPSRTAGTRADSSRPMPGGGEGSIHHLGIAWQPDDQRVPTARRPVLPRRS